MSNIKFYMNNPCEIIREISDDFSEVRVFPQFMDEDLNGSGWCDACMLGSMNGAHPSHSCEPYQEVIDVIKDTEAAMIVVVENRLLQDSPVEFKPWKKIREEITLSKQSLMEIDEIRGDVRKDLIRLSNYLVSVRDQIEDCDATLSLREEQIDGLGEELEGLHKKVASRKDAVSIGSVTLDITGDYLRELIKSNIKLKWLDDNGVEGWEWYGESIPSPDRLDELVQNEIRCISVKSI